MVSSTGYGYHGPWANFGATGPATEGASGLAFMTGYAGEGPSMAEIPYPDYTAAEHTVMGVMTALMHRLNTGRGQFIDISQTQALSATIPEALMDYSVNGRVLPRMGNQHPSMSPHGLVRQVEIPKDDGSRRPLGISCLEDLSKVLDAR